MNELNLIVGLAVALAIVAVWLVLELASKKGRLLAAQLAAREALEKEIGEKIEQTKHFSVCGYVYRAERLKRGDGNAA